MYVSPPYLPHLSSLDAEWNSGWKTQTHTRCYTNYVPLIDAVAEECSRTFAHACRQFAHCRTHYSRIFTVLVVRRGFAEQEILDSFPWHGCCGFFLRPLAVVTCCVMLMVFTAVISTCISSVFLRWHWCDTSWESTNLGGITLKHS